MENLTLKSEHTLTSYKKHPKKNYQNTEPRTWSLNYNVLIDCLLLTWFIIYFILRKESKNKWLSTAISKRKGQHANLESVLTKDGKYQVSLEFKYELSQQKMHSKCQIIRNRKSKEKNFELICDINSLFWKML